MEDLNSKWISYEHWRTEFCQNFDNPHAKDSAIRKIEIAVQKNNRNFNEELPDIEIIIKTLVNTKTKYLYVGPTPGLGTIPFYIIKILPTISIPISPLRGVTGRKVVGTLLVGRGTHSH